MFGVTKKAHLVPCQSLQSFICQRMKRYRNMTNRKRAAVIKKYDSTEDTRTHIDNIEHLLSKIIAQLVRRAIFHDESKLSDPEKKIFDEFTPKLKDSTYGSSEYKNFLEEMGVALEHHYQNNRHHPEHFSDGISGMTLIDIVEMVCDWKAATMRHDDGDIRKSLEINIKRFNISEQLACILENTINELDW